MILIWSTELIFDYIEVFWDKKWVSLGKVLDIEADTAWKRGIPCKFYNHSQLPNMFILLSFFGSLSHYFNVHRVDIWIYWGFLVIRAEFIWGKLSDVEAAVDWNRGIPCKFLKITHNYLICLFYYHFLVHFLIISRSTELIFDILIFSRSKRWGTVVTNVGCWGSYVLKQGTYCKI